MSGHAGKGLHFHGLGDERYCHDHWFLHINHEHTEDEMRAAGLQAVGECGSVEGD